MADFNFTVDAGKILAKMHRGGCQTHKDMVYINTGILNDQSATPEQVDGTKMTFNFAAGSWCEIGVIFENPMKLKLKYSEEELEAIGDEKKEPGKESGEENKEGGEENKEGGEEKEEGDEEKAVNEADEGASDQDKKASIGDKPEPAAGGEKKADAPAAGGDKPDEKKGEEKPGGEKKGEEKPGEEKKDDEKPGEEEGDEDLDPETEKKKEENMKSFQDALQKKKQLAVQYIKDYMTVFGGKESADKINEKGVVITFLEDKWADPTKVKEYKSGQIPAMDDKAIAEMINAQLKDGKDDKELELKNVCFKAAYSVSVKVED